MAVRPYTRPAASTRPDTELRIMAAAEELIDEGSFHQATVADLAARAGVARATVFGRFGSKLGALEALALRCSGGPEMRAIRDALAIEEPRAALSAVVEASCRHWERQGYILLTAKAVVELEPGALHIIDEQREDQRTSLLGLVERLDEAGALRVGLAVEEATATLHMLTSVESFVELHRHGKLPLDRIVAVLTGLAEGLLVPC